jgi:hypothetical protein
MGQSVREQRADNEHERQRRPAASSLSYTVGCHIDHADEQQRDRQGELSFRNGAEGLEHGRQLGTVSAEPRLDREDLLRIVHEEDGWSRPDPSGNGMSRAIHPRGNSRISTVPPAS